MFIPACTYEKISIFQKKKKNWKGFVMVLYSYIMCFRNLFKSEINVCFSKKYMRYLLQNETITDRFLLVIYSLIKNMYD